MICLVFPPGHEHLICIGSGAAVLYTYTTHRRCRRSFRLELTIGRHVTHSKYPLRSRSCSLTSTQPFVLSHPLASPGPLGVRSVVGYQIHPRTLPCEHGPVVHCPAQGGHPDSLYCLYSPPFGLRHFFADSYCTARTHPTSASRSTTPRHVYSLRHTRTPHLHALLIISYPATCSVYGVHYPCRLRLP